MSASAPRIRVWDAVVRLLHWALAAAVVAAWTFDESGPLHRGIGSVAAGCVAARLTWALLRPGAASLRSLRPSFAGTWRYLRAGAPRRLEHDPLGVWMVWALWLLVLLLAVTGWMSRLDAFWGDERLHDVHAALADLLIIAAGVHVVAVLAMSLRWRENLPLAMLTGAKRHDGMR